MAVNPKIYVEALASAAINKSIDHYAQGMYSPSPMFEYLNADISHYGLDFVFDSLSEKSKETIRQCILERDAAFKSCVQRMPILAVFRII